MPEELNLKQDAQWKQRYRLPTTYGIQIANANPAHGLAISSVSGVEQLYSWHIPTGRLKQLTKRPEGVGNTGDGIPNAAISPDGNYIYFLYDHKGDETGHFVRVPFEGGAIEDITPTLPPYVGFLFSFSQSGNRIGFTGIIDDVYAVYYLEVEPGNILGQPKILYQQTQQTIGPTFSYDGKIAVIEVKRPGTGSYDLIAVDTANGNEISRLSDGNEGSLEIYLSSPLIGDMRFLALSSHTGEERPFLWNPLTGERLDISLNGVEGDVIPMDWAASGHTSSRMLFRQNIQVAQHIYIYDVESDSMQQLPHSSGTFGTTEPSVLSIVI